MRKILGIMMLMAMGWLNITYAAGDMPMMDTRTMEPTKMDTSATKGKLPEGVRLVKKRVMLQKGYIFQKEGTSRVNVLSRMRNQITGTFDCTCNGNSGGCDVIVTGSSVSCAKSTCSSSCYMIVTIPGLVKAMQ